MKAFLLAASIMIVIGSPVSAAVIRVPSDQPTIQTGLDAALSGDIVLVAPGVYTESLEWPGLAVLTLRGEFPENRPVVSAPADKRCLHYTPGVSGTEMRLEHVVFENGAPVNQSGGALYVTGCRVQIDDCVFRNNDAGQDGGGVYFSTCEVSIANSTISDNHSIDHGGGGYFADCGIALLDCTVERNDTGVAEHVYSDGLGLYLNDCHGSVSHCAIRDHGNAYIDGSGIYARGDIDFVGNTFERNEQQGSDYYGGALNVWGSCLVRNNLFTDNVGIGSAIVAGGGVDIENCLFLGNASSFPGTGAILALDQTDVSFCTFVSNTSAGVQVLNSMDPVPIRHCIFSGNQVGIANYNGNSSVHSGYNAFWNNGMDYSAVNPGAGDLRGSDPLFVTGSQGAHYLSQTASGQSQTSPCVDAGDPETGASPGGTTRTDEVPDEGRVDLGYHFSAPDSPPVPAPTVTPATWTGVRLTLPDTDLQAGDRFVLTATCRAPAGHAAADLYVVLDVFGEYFFYPSWSNTPGSESIVLAPDAAVERRILDFVWPAGDVGVVTDLQFRGAILEPGTTSVIGEIDSVSFGYR